MMRDGYSNIEDDSEDSGPHGGGLKSAIGLAVLIVVCLALAWILTQIPGAPW